jgi:hypothetical protein
MQHDVAFVLAFSKTCLIQNPLCLLFLEDLSDHPIIGSFWRCRAVLPTQNAKILPATKNAQSVPFFFPLSELSCPHNQRVGTSNRNEREREKMETAPNLAFDTFNGAKQQKMFNSSAVKSTSVFDGNSVGCDDAGNIRWATYANGAKVLIEPTFCLVQASDHSYWFSPKPGQWLPLD